MSHLVPAPWRERVMSAAEAAALIQPGATVAMSGFTGSGYPKRVPLALAERMKLHMLPGRSSRSGC